MNQTRLLVENINQINEKFESCSRDFDDINLFKMLKISTHEASYSNFIFYLLEKVKNENLKNHIRESFFELVLKDKYYRRDSYEFRMESTIRSGKSKGKRPDFYISNKTKKIGYCIEVKTESGDRDKQLHNYEEFLKESDLTEYNLYYLTYEVRKATSNSITVNTKYKPISFNENIASWLLNCIDYLKYSHSESKLVFIIEEFLEIIGINNERNKKMELVELLKKGKNLRLLEEAIEETYKALDLEFLEYIRKQIIKISEFDNFNGNEDFFKKYLQNEEYTEIYFYQNFKSDVICYGISTKLGDESFEFFAGFESYINGEVLTEDTLRERFEGDWNQNNMGYYIKDLGIKKEDLKEFYYLHEEDYSNKKEILANQIIEEFFLSYNEFSKKISE